MANSTLEYFLPSITDPNNDTYSITVNLEDSFIFTQYKNSTFLFQPHMSDVKSTPYSIKITLKDHNQYPKQSVFTLLFTVKDSQSNIPSISAVLPIVNNTMASNVSMAKMIVASMKIKKVTKTGGVTLVVFSPKFPNLLVRQIDESMLNLTLI